MYRGYEIERINEKWFFCKSGRSVAETWEGLPCGHCGKNNTKEGHDGCLGTLPNVMNACCGHGQINEAYIQYWDGTCIRGDSAKAIFDKLIS